MLVFLIGEGPNDIGGLSRPPGYQTDDHGYLQPIVRSLRGGSLAFQGRKLATLPREQLKGSKDVLIRRAAAAVAIAETLGASLLVFATDLDGGSLLRDRRRAKQAHDGKRAVLREGCEVAEVPCVIAVPCRTIEAWALGDASALQSLFGGDPERELDRPPEDLWGNPRDPTSNHPKQVLRRVVGRVATSHDLSTIAETSDPATLRESCPVSFVPFADELTAAA